MWTFLFDCMYDNLKQIIFTAASSGSTRQKMAWFRDWSVFKYESKHSCFKYTEGQTIFVPYSFKLSGFLSHKLIKEAANHSFDFHGKIKPITNILLSIKICIRINIFQKKQKRSYILVVEVFSYWNINKFHVKLKLSKFF